MSSIAQSPFSTSLLLSPAIVSRPSSPDHPWRGLLQEARNHLHNLGRIEQAVSFSSKTDIQASREFAMWEVAWAEWNEEYNRALKQHRKSCDDDLRQIKLLLAVQDFKIETCRSSLRGPSSMNTTEPKAPDHRPYL
ncbi:hypothetical protein BC629DRAFT_1444879 [Irpex lacteus]|nr:hypothetical protein BC629DRAFT_1444879 [Irpex lacteus]